MKKIAQFFEDVSSKLKGIEVDSASNEEIDRYISGEVGYYDKEAQRVSSKIKEQLGIDIPDDKKYMYFLQGEGIQWHRPEQKSMEGLLAGGFYVNGMLDIFLYPLDFWESATLKFSKSGCEHLADIPNNMRWFESTVAHNSPIYKPHYGCVQFEPPSFPDKFYFYDSGFLYQLPFASLEEYFSAMIESAAVECWQYFYIDPEEIIKKNSDVSYITWSLHINTNLDRKMRGLTYDETLSFDRLDLINEYLERCVRLLPESFPFNDFLYHQEYYNTFKMLYDKEKS